ncbi:Amino acid permease 6, partial [Linum grandiflorum]
TASAHIITAVIDSGVLSLAWAITQLGWVAGPLVLMTFFSITWYTSTLLANAYRKVLLCGIAQYCGLVGTTG